MSRRNRARTSNAGPSANTPVGVYLSTQQLLDLVANAQAAGTPPLPNQPNFAKMCGDYTRLGGKSFKGSEGVMEVQAWINSCDRIFTCMNLSNLHRVQVASSMLEERARDWYDLLASEIDENNFTWEQFKERFESKFIPETAKLSLARRFMDLVQGGSSVAEYVASFESLSKYGAEYINTAAKKNQ